MINPHLIPSVPEAAEYIGTSRRTLAEWLSTGKYNVPHLRIGHKYAFDRRDLDVWLQKRKRNAPAGGRAA